MRVDVIDSYEKFAGLQSNWDSVYSSDPEAQFFLSWIWLSQLFLRRPDSWCVLGATPGGDDHEYVAFFPLRPMTRFSRSRRKYSSEIYMGGNFWADYTGFICRPESEQAAIPAFAEHLHSMYWQKLHLENFRASKRRTTLFTEQFARNNFRLSRRNRTSKVDGINNLICPGLRLPTSFDEYLQEKLSANTRQKIRRYQRKIDSSSDLRIDESSLADREQDLDALAAYWEARWADRKGSKVSTLARKYRKILSQGLQGNIVHLVALRHRDHPVVVHASFIDREKKCLLFFVAGRDQSWNRLPAGLMLHAYSIRWAIENNFKTYDLLSGNEPYKYSLGAEDKVLECIRIERRSGTQLYDTLNPDALNFVVQDICSRTRRADDELLQKLTQQILQTWPEDELAIDRCKSALIEAGDPSAARRFGRWLAGSRD